MSVKPSPRPAPPRPDESAKYRPSASRADRDRYERSSRDRYERSSRERGSRERSERSRPSRREREKDLDVFADPPPLHKSSTTAGGRPRERRPRRNSESSILERPKITDSEEDRRRRERRRRERERDGRHRDGKSSRSKRPVHMDIIDKLDVTGIYGTGSKFPSFFLFFGLLGLSDAWKCSITMVLSMRATPTGTVRACAQPRCRPSPKTRPTWRWGEPAP